MRRYVCLGVSLILAGCGSAAIAAEPAPKTVAPSARAALRLWRAFPAGAEPRPIVPLGEGLVVDPSTGFRTLAESVAYQDGHFALRARLPVFLVQFGSFRLVSPAAALLRLRAHGVHEHDNFPPLAITAARLGTATFATDRGRERLPAWQFFLRGAADPASVLALAPPSVFVPPPLHRLAPGGPGDSFADSATVSASGSTVTLSFPGAPAGTAPCDASYAARALGDRQAVAYTITTVVVPTPPGEACAAFALLRTAVLHLGRPLGARVLVSSADGGAIEVTPRR